MPPSSPTVFSSSTRPGRRSAQKSFRRGTGLTPSFSNFFKRPEVSYPLVSSFSRALSIDWTVKKYAPLFCSKLSYRVGSCEKQVCEKGKLLVFNRESGTAGMLFQHRKQGNGLDGAASVLSGRGRSRQFQGLVNSECIGNKLINIPISE